MPGRRQNAGVGRRLASGSESPGSCAGGGVGGTKTGGCRCCGSGCGCGSSARSDLPLRRWRAPSGRAGSAARWQYVAVPLPVPPSPRCWSAGSECGRTSTRRHGDRAWARRCSRQPTAARWPAPSAREVIQFERQRRAATRSRLTIRVRPFRAHSPSTCWSDARRATSVTRPSCNCSERRRTRTRGAARRGRPRRPGDA